MELTEKQEKFCQAYIELSDKSKAYRVAYDADAMNSNSVAVAAQEVFKNPNVTLRIEELQKELRERNKVKIDDVIGYLADMIKFDIAEIYEENGRMKSIHDIPKPHREMILSVKVYEDFMNVDGQREKIAESNVKIITPQEGYQLDFASSPADICIGGGAAGVGKTFSLLLEPIRHKDIEGFGSVIFRRTNTQIRNEGGLWDTSIQLYSCLDAIPRQSSLEWMFGKSKLKFSNLEYEKNIYDWQGSQIPLIGFDELTHFTKKMFFYLLTRNRSVCGVNPYVRATCNPDPDSWVAEFISWWIDQDTGFAIPERRGVLRYLIVD